MADFDAWAPSGDPKTAVQASDTMGPLDVAAAYRDHANAVYGVARMIVGATVAEDVTQEVFVELWRRPDCFDPARGSLRTFLLTVAHHRAVDVVRSETARSARQRRIGNNPLHTHDSDHGMSDFGDAEMIAAALGELATKVRAAIVTAYFGGLTYREVAAVLGEAEGTIKSRIRHGLTHLRSILERPEFG